MAANALPCHHHDPADRFIIATAHSPGAAVVMADRRFDDYHINVRGQMVAPAPRTEGEAAGGVNHSFGVRDSASDTSPLPFWRRIPRPRSVAPGARRRARQAARRSSPADSSTLSLAATISSTSEWSPANRPK